MNLNSWPPTPIHLAQITWITQYSYKKNMWLMFFMSKVVLKWHFSNFINWVPQRLLITSATTCILVTRRLEKDRSCGEKGCLLYCTVFNVNFRYMARGFLDPNPHCLRAQEDKSWRCKYIIHRWFWCNVQNHK